MKFKNFRKNKKLMDGYEVIIYDDETGRKLYHDILPVGLSKNGSKQYQGLQTSEERAVYDNLFEEYGHCNITDSDIDNENKQIFIDITI